MGMEMEMEMGMVMEMVMAMATNPYSDDYTLCVYDIIVMTL